MRLIDADKLKEELKANGLGYQYYMLDNAPTVEAIPVEQLLNILPKYDDYIHTKTYLYDEISEDIYSKGHEEGWNAYLKAIKEELEDWEKENGRSE